MELVIYLKCGSLPPRNEVLDVVYSYLFLWHCTDRNCFVCSWCPGHFRVSTQRGTHTLLNAVIRHVYTRPGTRSATCN